MDTIKGSLGLTLPVQNLSASREVNMTVAEVLAWRNHLPMADMGGTAKRVYQAVSDCNKITLSVSDRFQILELIRSPLQFICQSLRKHYIQHLNSLTEQQLMIANLAQTLQLEMSKGYKLLVEQLADKANLPQEVEFLGTSIQRVMHYHAQVLLRHYQLYSLSPPELWRELHLLYQLAAKKNLLSLYSIEDHYKQILLLAASYPYQWRQTEQDAIYSATEKWAQWVSLRTDLPDISQAGFLVINLEEDSPPQSPSRGLLQVSANSKILDVSPLIEHLKTLIAQIEPNELKARMEHGNDTEFALSTSILKGLIKEWETTITRHEDRMPLQESVQICVGLMGTHYFLNHQKAFDPHSTSELGDTFNLTLPALSEERPDFSPDASNKAAFPTYECTLTNQNTHGYGLLWKEKTYPPLQAGEVIGLSKAHTENPAWEVCKVRWLLRLPDNTCKIGIERLSVNATAGAAQLIKDGQAAEYHLRCLILENSILVPILPFKTGSQINVSIDSTPTTSLMLELGALTDATGSYKRFLFKSKQSIMPESLAQPMPTSVTLQTGTPASEMNEEIKQDKFDALWEKL